MKELNTEMLKELENNQEFVARVRACENADEVYTTLTEYGMDLS